MHKLNILSILNISKPQFSATSTLTVPELGLEPLFGRTRLTVRPSSLSKTCPSAVVSFTKPPVPAEPPRSLPLVPPSSSSESRNRSSEKNHPHKGGQGVSGPSRQHRQATRGLEGNLDGMQAGYFLGSGKTVFQSFFMSTMIQPFSPA
jgi:hypothetical protein